MSRNEPDQEALLLELRSLRQQVARLSEAAAEREHRDEALRLNEELFRQIFEEGPIGMHLVSPEFRMLKVNAAFCRMLDCPSHELVGRPLAEILHPDDVATSLDQASRMRSGEIPSYVTERRYMSRDGRVLWANVRVSVIRDSRGGPLYGLGVVENVSERKRAEQARAFLEEQLRQSQKMEAVGQLAGGVAHDFNNLLTVILGNVDQLRSSLEALPRSAIREDAEDSLNEIHVASERAVALIRRLLTLGRKDRTRPRVLDLNRVVSETGRMLRRLIGEQITLESNLDPRTPAVLADVGHLEQVILNLVINARDAMPRGGKLRIETGRSGDLVQHAELTVRDNGIGMDRAVLDRIFEPFFTTKPTGKGSGLGLATVYGIVTQAGGQISAESEPGSGSTFTIRLPACEDQVTAEPPSADDDISAGEELVLVCEDEEQVRRITCEALRSYGYEVLEASGPVHALELGAQEPRKIQLLVTDVIMPEMNGLELARRLTSVAPAMPVLFISGYTSQILDSHGINGERLSFLEKPFNTRALLKHVRRILDESAQTSEQDHLGRTDRRRGRVARRPPPPEDQAD